MDVANLTCEVVSTQPFEGQKPGTSGLRKPVGTFKQAHYTENFVQAIFNVIPPQELKGSTIVVGGDGRYFMDEAIKTIISMAAANEVGKLIIGEKGIISTPAISCLIRKRKVLGGIILTASHNPGGPHGDFGIKYNTSNGGPAPEKFTNSIFSESKAIKEYRIVKNLTVDLTVLGVNQFNVDGRSFSVEVIDSVDDYVELMKEIFDFPAIRSFLKDFKIIANGMNGVTGPYIKRIVCDELGAGDSAAINFNPLEDFGGKHPDPNMTYAADFVELMKEGQFKFGAAFDGDGDRNMLLGEKAFFVNPSDSIAIIAANADCIPYFKKNKLKGVARSMPTGAALDRVAEAEGMECFEVPTGWKFFGNLMDAGRVALCGEESFGTGSDHIREKDGIWAFLAWLSILASKQTSVKDILESHWQKFGRNYFTRYDYEGIATEKAVKMMERLRALTKDGSLVGQKFDEFVIDKVDDFKYTDPIDASVTEKQGIRIIFKDKSRIVFRLSATSSTDATVRIYIEKFLKKPDLAKSCQDVVKSLAEIALKISKLTELTGRETPTVTT